LVVWGDALALLADLADPKDEMLSNGVLSLGRHRADQLGVDLAPGVAHDALLALADVGYVVWTDDTYAASGGVTFTGLHVTGKGMQALGQWPTLDTIMTPASLAHLLDALADYASDTDKGTALQVAAAYARKFGAATLRQAVVGYGAAQTRTRLGL
jgi:hypothetical protein